MGGADLQRTTFSKGIIDGFLESPGRLIHVLLGLLVVYVVIRGIVGALWRPLWFDELLTLSIARQPSLRASWNAIKVGFDATPPAFQLLERAALHLSRHPELALRIPSIIAFAVTVVCVFFYARKRNGEIAALLCAVSLLPTLLFHTYAIEARSYSMVIACMALAMVCYQRIASRRWAVLFGLALVVAELLHYYAVFAMLPFWIAEGVMLLRTRQFRWLVWLALVCGALPLVMSFPLLAAIKGFYGAQIYSSPVLGEVKGYYARFLLLNEYAVGVALAVLAVAGIVWAALAGKHATRTEDEENFAEAALLLSLVVLPYIMFVLLELTHGPLLNRYVLVTVLAVVLGILTAFRIAGQRAVAIYALLLLCITGAKEATFWHHVDPDLYNPYFSATSARELDSVKQLMATAGQPALPIVVSDCLLDAQFSYYFEPPLRNRIVYLVDEARELQVSRTDSASRAQKAFSKVFPIRLADFSEFTTSHKEFLFYVGDRDWNSPIFREQGYSMQLLNTDNRLGSMYLVKTNGPSSP